MARGSSAATWWTRWLVGRGASVTVFDNLSTGFRQLVRESATVKLVVGDLLDQAALDAVVVGHDFVFHFAANADVKEGLLHPRRDVEQNILATQNLLEAMRANGVKRIGFTSTGSAYGEPNLIPTPEDCPWPVQTSLYGASKLACEGFLSAYAYGYGFRAWAFRCVSMLGPRYSHGHVIDFYRKLKTNPLELHVLGDGHQRKSYLHVTDSIEAMLTAIEKGPDDALFQAYNLGYEGWLEVNESIAIICRELGVHPKITYAGGERGWIGDSPRIYLDTTRIRALGWSPKTSMETAVVETLRFLGDNPYLLERYR